MKHFIAFAALGLSAVGSGMALAAHFALPCSKNLEAAPRMAEPDLPSLSSIDASSLQASLPSPDEAMNGAGRAFGQATATMERYSDKAFGPTAMKIKRSADAAGVPSIQ